MANCYICGKPNVNYKREVHTGNSYRTTFSMKGNAYLSQSAHFGSRVVCAKCALNIDKKMNSKPHWIFILLLILMGLLPFIFGLLPVFISNLPVKFFIPIGITWICVFILIFAAAKIDGKQRGVRWYDSNKYHYVDEIDIKQACSEKIQEKAVLEEQLKVNEIQKSSQSILELLNQSQTLLETKVDYINTNYASLNLCTMADCDKVLKELKGYESEIIKSKDSILKQVDFFTKQTKNYNLTSDLIGFALKPVSDNTVIYSDMVSQFLTGLKTAENQILQAKIDIMKQDKVE